MARIRSIKPDFFKHEELYDAEKETGLPLRVAFAGLWTQCDREGRFEWRPRQLKTDVLPYDEIDFSRVLDALATRGFIVRYRVEGTDYAFVPSWRKHQVVNNKERKSELPEPTKKNITNSDIENASATREERDSNATATRSSTPFPKYVVEGEGEREVEGEEPTKKTTGGAQSGALADQDDLTPPPSLDRRRYAFQGRVIRLTAADLERWRKAYPKIADLEAELTAADDYYATNPPKDGKWFFAASNWLKRANERAIEDSKPPPDLDPVLTL